MVEKEKLLQTLSEYKVKNEQLKLYVYEGYSIIHIDFILKEDESTAMFTTIDLGDERDISIKIAKTNSSNFGFDKLDKILLDELKSIKKYIKADRVYGRITLNDEFEKYYELFTNLGYSIKQVYDKSYATAKINFA